MLVAESTQGPGVQLDSDIKKEPIPIFRYYRADDPFWNRTLMMPDKELVE